MLTITFLVEQKMAPPYKKSQRRDQLENATDFETRREGGKKRNKVVEEQKTSRSQTKCYLAKLSSPCKIFLSTA